MPYPHSPFKQNLNLATLLQLKEHQSDEKIENENQVYLNKVLKWLCSTPKITSFRVNTLLYSVDENMIILKSKLDKLQRAVQIEKHPLLPDTILLYNWKEDILDLEKRDKEVIVDVNCAAAVLRGAHIFAPGVMGLLTGIKINDKVSIYADLTGKCKKGLQIIYNSPKKLFIGNGTVEMTRNDLFKDNITPTGIAVRVTDTISKCPIVNVNFFPVGSTLLQNIPSIVCVHVLNPQPGDVVLDMCASPGNKTTHIAALMRNKGTLIAIDKTATKVKTLRSKCEEFQAKAHIFEANSINIVNIEDDSTNVNEVENGPPFCRGIFDKILLDAPCSALGKRPQLSNTMSEKVIQSYIPLQRKLFENAVHLLKMNGRLVYSTCTITLAENEGIVSWALKNFNCLELVKLQPHLGGSGLAGTNLSDLQRTYVQRFGPDDKVDSVGFFIASFIKRKI